MVIRLGINGFGRIGRVIFRASLKKTDLEIAAINDPAIDVEYICYLIKFDSTHGKLIGCVTHNKDEIFVDGCRIKVFHEKLPFNVPWQTAGVHYVIEASGMFTSLEKASGHLASAGVKRVIVTAPSVDVPMVILGVNEEKLNAGQKVISCASSTLYCLAPIVKVLDDGFGVAEGFVTSIHAMTPSLKPLDGLCLRGKHWRDYRSIHQNIIPASTGACRALGRVLPRVKDRLSGLAFRVPIVNVSVLDLTIRLSTNTTLQEIIKRVENAGSSTMKNIIKVSRDEAVSSDFIGETHSCILDADSSLQLKTNFFKLVCWYENEYSYGCRVIDSVLFSEKQMSINSTLKMLSLRTNSIKKQDVLQQTDRCNTDVLCSVSEETKLKSKYLQSKSPIKKPTSSNNSCTTQSLTSSRDTKKRNEIFKIWDDAKDKSIRQNRNPFFHSCVAITPQSREEIECIKAHERLEMLKKEFSKMVRITESLLNKSYIGNAHDKTEDKPYIKKELTKYLNVLPEINVEEIKNSCDTFTEICDRREKSNPLFDVGDYSSSIHFKNTKIANKSEDQGVEITVPQFQIYPPSKKINNESRNKLMLFEKLPSRPIFHATKRILPEKMLKKNDDNKGDSRKKPDAALKPKDVPQKNQVQYYVVENKSKTNDTKYTKPSLKESNSTQEKCNNSFGTSDSGISSLLKKSNASELVTMKQSSNNEHANNEIQNNTNVNSSTECRNTEHKSKEKQLEKSKDVDTVDNSFSSGNKPENADETIPAETGKNDVKELNKKSLDDIIKSCSPYPALTESDRTSKCVSPGTTSLTISNVDVYKHKQDIYDKLDSISGTDSNNSFQINERKSQIINLSDLTSSLEDLARLDKICKIIEISDELSDKLFAALDSCRDGFVLRNKKWSFKDLCERIKLDEFCEKIFGKTSQ